MLNGINAITKLNKMKKALVLGAGGFIGSHLVKRLKEEQFYVVGVDLKYPEFSTSTADKFLIGDLRNQTFVDTIFSNQQFEEVYQLAADMGGAGYVFTGENDAQVMFNSAQINLNIVHAFSKQKKGIIFFASSACVYPEHNQQDALHPNCKEESVYPANPDSNYGWEKLFSERLFQAFQKNEKIEVRIARLHNVFGTEGTWQGGKEKAPAALCRKIALANNGEAIEIWGSGNQTRSFLYIDECLDGIRRLMNSNCSKVLNIGSEEMISINDLAKMIIAISGKELTIKNIEGPVGVNGRNSDNTLIAQELNWAPQQPLKQGIEILYKWIEKQVQSSK